MIPCGDAEVIADQMASGFDAPSYLRAMDAQGIDGVVLYPSIGLFVPFQPELTRPEAAACRAYNDWVAGYCAADQRGIAGVALVPFADPAPAAARPSGRPTWVWSASSCDRTISTAGTWVTWPTPALRGAGRRRRGAGRARGAGAAGPDIGGDRFAGFTARHLLSHPMEQMAAMAGLVLDGALARHPDLKVAFLESGTGWLSTGCTASTSTRSGWTPSADPGVGALFARQCVISTEADDALTASVIDGWAPTTWCGPATSPTPTRCSPTPPPPSWPRPAAGDPDADLARSSGTPPSPSTPRRRRILTPCRSGGSLCCRAEEARADGGRRVAYEEVSDARVRGCLRHHGPVHRRGRRPPRPVSGAGGQAPGHAGGGAPWASFIDGLRPLRRPPLRRRRRRPPGQRDLRPRPSAT